MFRKQPNRPHDDEVSNRESTTPASCVQLKRDLAGMTYEEQVQHLRPPLPLSRPAAPIVQKRDEPTAVQMKAGDAVQFRNAKAEKAFADDSSNLVSRMTTGKSSISFSRERLVEQKTEELVLSNPALPLSIQVP